MSLKPIALLLVISLASSAQAAGVDCKEKSLLLATFKIKTILFVKMAEKGFPKVGPLRCELLNEADIKEIKLAKDNATAECLEGKDSSFGQSQISLQDSIKELTSNALSGDDEKCVGDNFQNELNVLAKAKRDVGDIQTICKSYSPIHEKMFTKLEYCDKVKASNTDPSSCEIPGPDGNCPGATGSSPINQVAPQPAQRSQTTKSIHWGKVKSR